MRLAKLIDQPAFDEAWLVLVYEANDLNSERRHDGWDVRGSRLNEVYSLEDAARRAYRRSSQLAAVPLLRESPHPLLHLMYSLRHINVHVKPSTASIGEVTIRLNDPDDDREFSWGAVMLADETEADMLENSEVKKHYRTEDVRRTIAWVFENQQAFGIGQVFRLGAEAYCREVLSALRPE